jgi:hypothetical protein
MKRGVFVSLGLVLVSVLSVALSSDRDSANESAPARDAPVATSAAQTSGFYLGESGLTPSQRAGREIWYKATAGNARFHTYVFQQRLGVWIDWYRVLRADERAQRFKTWGLINDPDCCTPGSPGCPARSMEETYGFDYCAGDEAVLAYVGKRDIAIRPATSRTRPSRRTMCMDPAISASPPAISRSERRPERSAIASFPTPASMPRSGGR